MLTLLKLLFVMTFVTWKSEQAVEVRAIEAQMEAIELQEEIIEVLPPQELQEGPIQNAGE